MRTMHLNRISHRVSPEEINTLLGKPYMEKPKRKCNRWKAADRVLTAVGICGTGCFIAYMALLWFK